MKRIAALALLACSCAEMSEADKAQLAIDGAKAVCSFYEAHPGALKPEQARLLAEVCPVLATAERE